jgi:drug/metabolite transporter (DMT)-like permease
VVNVILNIQPVISTIGAFLLFGDRLARQFFFYAAVAIVAGVFVSVTNPSMIGVSFEWAGLNLGTGYALICALFWGLSTVAGRGVMMGMSLRLASSMRIVVGLACMTLILLGYGKLDGAALWPATAQAHTGKAIVLLFCLASISGGIRLDLFLRSPRARQLLVILSDANARRRVHHLGRFPCQPSRAPVVAAIILIAAVAMVHHATETLEQAND